jgi:hypothetical protein
MSIDEAGEQIEEASEETGSRTKWFARLYMIGLLLAILGAAWLLYSGGSLTPDVSPTASPDFTDEAELLGRGLVIIFLAFTAGWGLVALPGNYINAVSGIVGRFLHGYTDERYQSSDDDE